MSDKWSEEDKSSAVPSATSTSRQFCDALLTLVSIGNFTSAATVSSSSSSSSLSVNGPDVLIGEGGRGEIGGQRHGSWKAMRLEKKKE